jgi:hypothetical protein
MLPKFRVGLLATASVMICLLPTNIRSVDAGQAQDDSVGVINRKEKVGRPKPRTKTIQAPLLSLQWWLMIRGRDCHPQEFDSTAAFAVDDKVRIGISVNQSGFLYVVLENKPGADATLIYPDPRINRGSNLVRKNTPVILPSNCPSPESRDSDCPMDVRTAEDCWWIITKRYNGSITLIFSRDKMDEFESLIEKAVARRTGTPDLPSLRWDLLERIKRETVQEQDLRSYPTRPQPGAMGTIVSNFTTRVTNTNRRDNEEIVETITLKLQNR